jgi:hypothetical protein
MTTMRSIGSALALSALLAYTLAPSAAQAERNRGEKEHGKAANPFANIPVSGTSADGNTFAGTMNVQGFVTDELGRTKAIGVLFGAIADGRGAQHLIDNQVVTVPVAAGNAVGTFATGTVSAQQLTCPVLNLVLAPLDLNLLGLTVHLDQVVLDVAAVAGAGALLGNLLCAVTNLLSGGILGAVLSQLLNNLLGALAGAGI